MITIAIQEWDIETIEDIARRFRNDVIIQEQIKILKHEIQQMREKRKRQEEKRKLELEDEMKLREPVLNEIKTKIYYEIEKIEPQDIIQNEQLAEYQKLYILLAIYEKEKKVNNIKELAKQYKESKEIKDINIVLQRAISKKKQIFNWEFYDDALGWNIDKKMKEEYEQNIKEQKEREMREIKEKQKRQEEKEQERKLERENKMKLREKLVRRTTKK